VNYCDGSVQSTAPNLYFACPSKGCGTSDSPVITTATQQVTNPIRLFSNDNNGVIVQLPPVTGTEQSVTALIIFGIGTQSNNDLGSATVFTIDANGNFTTVYNGQTLGSSFIDSGSNGLFFPDTIPSCATNTRYFCPSSLLNLSATIQGATQGTG